MDKKKEIEDSPKLKKQQAEQLKINMDEPIAANKNTMIRHKIEVSTVEATTEDGGIVGSMLKKVRTDKKLSLESISAKLNIKVSQLVALENGDIDKLPGMVYAIGFTRNYATYLGLDGEEIIRLFKKEHLNIEKNRNISFPEPVTESGMPGPTLIGVGAFLSIILLLAWVFYSSVDMGNKNNITEDPAFVEASQTTDPSLTGGEIASSQEALAPTDVTTAVPAGTTAAPVATDGTTGVAPAPVDATTAPTTQGEATATVPAQITAAPQAQVVGQDQSGESQLQDLKSINQEVDVKEVETTKPGEVVKTAATADEKFPEAAKQNIEIKKKATAVVLKAKEASWIQITDKEQKVIFRKVLRPGDEYAVPDGKGLTLVTANAGGLDVFVQGEQVQSIGESGEIVRGISLDPNSLKTQRVKAGLRR